MHTLFLGVFPSIGTRFSDHMRQFSQFETEFVKPLLGTLAGLPRNTIGRIVFFPRQEEVDRRELPEEGPPGHEYTPTVLRVELIRQLFPVHIETCLDCNRFGEADSEACQRTANLYARAQNAMGIMMWFGGPITPTEVLRHHEQHSKLFSRDGKVGVTVIGTTLTEAA